ncbi:phosphotransferase family protein [Cellulosimicrobium terreum]|nr:phosphotransferase family protein [Cellulosimicrobium terreum]
MTPPTPDPPGLDVHRLDVWLRREHPALTTSTPVTAALIAGGRSNLTYRLDGTTVPLVLRRPPLGHVLSTAHDMAREHRVISALADTDVPVPPVVDVVDDSDGQAGTGTPFFLMEHVAGDVLADPAQNAAYTPAELHALGLELAETLADLHRVDPAAVGLGDFGRPGGYLGRQLRRWATQLDASRSRDVAALDELGERLRERVPENSSAGIVHGDFRLDNVIVGRDPGHGPRVAAVLDWEMATLGDPAVDVGMLGLYWGIRSLGDTAAGVTTSAVDPAAGYPSFDEVVDAYEARLGRSVPELSWYRAFGAYKLGVILEGVHFRYQAGETVGDGFDAIGGLVRPLADEGLAGLAGVGRR